MLPLFAKIVLARHRLQVRGQRVGGVKVEEVQACPICFHSLTRIEPGAIAVRP